MSSQTDRPIATPLHTIVLLAWLTVWSTWSAFRAQSIHQVGTAPVLLLSYAISILNEWAVFVYVIWGDSTRSLLGPRWRSPREFFRDIGLGLLFWLVAGIALASLARAFRVPPSFQSVSFMIPRTAAEKVMWLLVSVTAGITEETIFRGYLQRQFSAFGKNPILGLLLSAIAFGSVHAYQGSRSAALIGVYGLMFGCLAYWRRSIRPGMIAHAWQDTLAGLLAGVLERYR